MNADRLYPDSTKAKLTWDSARASNTIPIITKTPTQLGGGGGGGGGGGAGSNPVPPAVMPPVSPAGMPPVSPAVPKHTAGNKIASGSGSSKGPTAEQRAAATNLSRIAGFNADSARSQFDAAKAGYDQANSQNREQAQRQQQQNSMSSAGDRFGQMLKMQSASSGMSRAAGNALQGSQAHNMSRMLDARNNMDTAETHNTLRGNQNAVINSLNESLNANSIAQNEAAWKAEMALRGIEADTAAQMNNIHSGLFVNPGEGTTNMGASGYASSRLSQPDLAQLMGYFTSAPANKAASSTAFNTGSSYFDQLMNSYRR